MPRNLPFGRPAAVLIALTTLLVIASAAAAAAADRSVTTTPAGSAAAVTASHPGTGAVSENERETIELWMAGHEQAAQRFVDAVSAPGSGSYHRYLSPSGYTRRFGASAQQLRAVTSYLTGQGFTQVHASVNDDYVSATAPVSAINQAFSLQMRRSDVAGADGTQATIASKDHDLTVPVSISRDVLAITGLNTTEPQADDATTSPTAISSTSTTPTSNGAGAKALVCSRYWAQKTQTISPAFDGLTKAAIPVCGYSAKQIRDAYGLTSTNTGKGKTIALIQVGAPNDMFKTLTDYAKANGLAAPRSGQYREQKVGASDSAGGKSKACVNSALEEAPLDSETAYAMAPGANQLMVEGNDCDKDYAQALLNAMLAPLTGHGSRASATIESVSYSLAVDGESSVPASDLKASHAIALRAAAEGVSLLVDSGDTPGVKSPASDPDVTAVGGTTLGIGAHNQRLFETGWSTAFGERTGTSGPWYSVGIQDGAGGGASTVYSEPSYQQAVVPSSLSENSEGHSGRAVPDVSADADRVSGMRLGLILNRANGKPRPYEMFMGDGTSMATPLVAGMIADAEQGQSRNFGLLNPLLYSLAGTRAFHDALPLSPSDPQVDRAIYTPGLTDLNKEFTQGFLVGVNDVQDQSGTNQVTALGYDTMTGLGTPNGTAFIKALRRANSA